MTLVANSRDEKYSPESTIRTNVYGTANSLMFLDSSGSSSQLYTHTFLIDYCFILDNCSEKINRSENLRNTKHSPSILSTHFRISKAANAKVHCGMVWFNKLRPLAPCDHRGSCQGVLLIEGYMYTKCLWRAPTAFSDLHSVQRHFV